MTELSACTYITEYLPRGEIHILHRCGVAWGKLQSNRERMCAYVCAVPCVCAFAFSRMCVMCVSDPSVRSSSWEVSHIPQQIAHAWRLACMVGRRLHAPRRVSSVEACRAPAKVHVQTAERILVPACELVSMCAAVRSIA